MALINNYEVLDMALQIERNGIRFYGKAADQAPDESLRRLLRGLADMERGHEQLFLDMRAGMPPAERQVDLADKEGVAAAYLDSLMRGLLFDPATDPIAWLDASPTPVEVLKRAIALEKDSVLFYLGIREIVAMDAHTRKIDQIIKEEKSHIVMLSGELRKLMA